MSVHSFPLVASAKTMKFTKAERQAVLAAGYAPGLETWIASDDGGDEWAAIGPDQDFIGLNCVLIVKNARAVHVQDDGVTVATFASIHDTLALAREVILDRITRADEITRNFRERWVAALAANGFQAEALN